MEQYKISYMNDGTMIECSKELLHRVVLTSTAQQEVFATATNHPLAADATSLGKAWNLPAQGKQRCYLNMGTSPVLPELDSRE